MLKRKKTIDKRINAPLISTRSYFAILGALMVLVTFQAFILEAFLDNGLTLFGVFLWYVGACGLLISLVVGIIRKYFYGRPIQIISKAAREITNGDFSVRVEPIRTDGKKDEIEVLIEDFNTMATELQSTELFKNDFIANVTHEIKTPLSIIQSYTKTLTNPNLSDEERVSNANIVLVATQNLSTMVTNMLKLNKLENQGIVPEMKPFQLGEQLRNCALSFSSEWERKGIDFYINVIDVEVKYDASLLELVWNNLIANALKFTEPGGSVKVASYRDRNYVYVSVTDTGCGIEQSEKEKVFDKFYQVDQSRSTDGNGLGLSLVKKVLDILKCDISIDTEIGIGTSFTVRLEI